MATLPGILSLSKFVSLVFVDDGSTDGSEQVIYEFFTARQLDLDDKCTEVRVVRLSRNFGKESALSAGLEASNCDATVFIDCDLQDPPNFVTQMILKWGDGFDMVVPVRSDREGERVVTALLSRAFYRIFNLTGNLGLVDGAGDFRLLDRRVTDAIKALPEKARFMKGIFTWVGFSTCFVPYQRELRRLGASKFSRVSLVRLALRGVLSFSHKPLYLSFFVGVFTSSVGLTYALFIITRTLFFGVDFPGYASLTSMVLILGGLNIFFLGLLSAYVAQLFVEVKGRPSYLVRETLEVFGKRE